MKKGLIILMMSAFAIVPTFAQKAIKLGHLNSQELLLIVPGRDAAQEKLQAHVAELEATLKTMETELQARYNEYMEKENQMSDLIKQTKQREIQDMSVRVEEFRASAQKELQAKEAELFQPIIEKAKQAIADVAKEHKYTYILDAAGLLYQDDSEDILPLVKKKLGI
ncbi:OmpH family outer membrane protein [Bacteroidales bacterium OttesenSCG-928-C19]|nr:OmpH family outer membrane protein [Bacteroidales bacterium OttesenSCG-928-C19]